MYLFKAVPALTLYIRIDVPLGSFAVLSYFGLYQNIPENRKEFYLFISIDDRSFSLSNSQEIGTSDIKRKHFVTPH